MNIAEGILVLCGVIYSGFIAWCMLGWNKIPLFVRSTIQQEKFISVIVPARDEEKHIHRCLTSLYGQNYSKALYEVIVVDDDSSDLTSHIVQEFMLTHQDFICRVIKLEDTLALPSSKKQAIAKAVDMSGGEIIITTDADCIFPSDWIETVMAFYEEKNAGFVSGPVILSEERSFVEKIQSLEFLGLVAIGAASIQHNHPILCNGANISYRKDIFLKVGGYNQDLVISGDDTHLLRKVHELNAGKIGFVKSPDACVVTQGINSWKGLFQQRLRWVSKIPGAMNVTTVIIASAAYFLHLGILWSVFSCNNVGLVVWFTKALVEFVFLFGVSAFYGKKRLLFYFIPAQIIYPVYITFLGFFSLVGSFHWKGRSLHVKRNAILQ